ncbi:hypothetical protein ABI59_07205 [Acidobacteria bacterium Mor1]|nr:hypothetical protein ABI59_07205 [Acidobacteria bacterium Mor1]
MVEFGLILLLAGAVATGGYLYVQARRQQVLERFAAETGEIADEPAPAPVVGSVLKQRRALVWFVAAAVGLIAYLLGLRAFYCVAITVQLLVALLLLEEMRVEKLTSKIETQLVEAIDLMIGALRAGASLPVGIESAIGESRKPLRPLLENLAGRLRMGEAPGRAFADLERRLPLVTVRLFALSIAVNIEAGGSLVDVLVGVARTIRDRIELAQRARAQSVQAQLSAVAILIIGYLLALGMWRTNEERFLGFLVTDLGAMLLGSAMILQALGLAWMSRLSRLEG